MGIAVHSQTVFNAIIGLRWAIGIGAVLAFVLAQRTRKQVYGWVGLFVVVLLVCVFMGVRLQEAPSRSMKATPSDEAESCGVNFTGTCN